MGFINLLALLIKLTAILCRKRSNIANLSVHTIDSEFPQPILGSDTTTANKIVVLRLAPLPHRYHAQVF